MDERCTCKRPERERMLRVASCLPRVFTGLRVYPRAYRLSDEEDEWQDGGQHSIVTVDATDISISGGSVIVTSSIVMRSLAEAQIASSRLYCAIMES
eukprot:2100403-Prymnesium_polylepis.1